MSILDNYKSLTDSFYNKTKIIIQEGTVFDSFFLAFSEAITSLQETIQKNKTPHIYSDLRGDALDSFGMLMGIKRASYEIDEQYLKRVMDSRATYATSNIVAINNAILNLENAAYVKYTPMSHGASTATISIIPNDYDASTIKLAIQEVQNKLITIIDPSTYLFYEIPEPRAISLGIVYSSTNMESLDEVTLTADIEDSIREYVNNISPMGLLKVGEIERLGLNISTVDYFKVYTLYIDGEAISDLEVLQKPNEKYLLDKINFERR